MTAKELKQVAWEMDATASALAAILDLGRDAETVNDFAYITGKAAQKIASLQAYAHALQAEAAKEGAA